MYAWTRENMLFRTKTAYFRLWHSIFIDLHGWVSSWQRGLDAGPFIFSADCRMPLFPMQWGGFAPHAGAGSTFSTSKRYQKTPWGCAPWYPQQSHKKDMVLQNLTFLTFTESPFFAGKLCANRTKPNQARLLTFWALSES